METQNNCENVSSIISNKEQEKTSTTIVNHPNYKSKTVKELKEECQKRGIIPPKNAKKNDLISLLENQNSNTLFDNVQ